MRSLKIAGSLNDFSGFLKVQNWLAANASVLWNATGGALIVLFLSIVSQQRRSWKSLTVGCIFGALGSSFIGYNFADRWWVYPACGVAAIVTENLCLAAFNLSAKFRDDPVNIVTHFIKLFIPTFGKVVGDSDYKDESGKPQG
jgi:hypothetical protein